MTATQLTESKRKRAPSKRALATKTRVLDAAEKVFAARGFDGATIRDIATEAGEPIGTIHHHGGGKEALFHQIIARRAEALSQARLTALSQIRARGDLTLDTVLSAFIRPFFDLTHDDPRWRHYARLVAFVSVDDRWQDISAQFFDPTAAVFMEELLALVPHASRPQLAEGFVFSVSAMLALLTSQDRIGTLSGGQSEQDAQIDHLVRFCAAGIAA
ncbi:TetR/AcrR family transcriptional regulator [Roseovarius sp. A21]|uniref:TetR/AcrR family transcriptional regulator n=1 Tax=Roseovarius bejariae TaxID=2576383 RepID=A0A844CY45_9RHOB|nr:TetR/AcrR family transcriptional regulator [Roseovarius bejariae]MRU14974.1 TetR/AcrR family transcriptional regulator [Roseovarius bejariae]